MASDAPEGPAIPIAKLDRTDTVDFEREILPMLRSSCLACHNRTRAKADLVLETPADILKGSENGAVVQPGKADDSLLLKASAHTAKPVMPPKDNKSDAADLTGEQLALLRLWINQGAKGEVRHATAIQWQAPAASVQPIYALALTNDGHYAAAGRGNQIDLYDLTSQRYAGSLTDPKLARVPHRDMVESLAFSPDRTLLASGSFGEVKLWRRTLPAKQLSFVTPAGGASTPRLLAASSDGQRIAAAAEGWPIELFDAATGRAIGTLASSTSAATGIAFSPDGRRLAVASADGGLRVSEVATGALIAQTVIPGGAGCIAWLNGNTLATGGTDGALRTSRVPDFAGAFPAASREWKAHPGPITCLATMPGGDLLSAGADGAVRQWHAADGQRVRETPTGGPVATLAVRPDGKAFATAGTDGPAKLWDAATGKLIGDLKGDPAADRELAARDRQQKVAAADVAYFTAVHQQSEAARKAAADRVMAATAAKTAAEKASNDAIAARDKAAAGKVAAEKALAVSQQAIRIATTQATAVEQSLKDAQKATTQPSDATVAARTKAAAEAKAKVQQLAADAKPKQAVEAAAKALAQAETQLPATAQTLSNAKTELTLAIDGDGRSTTALETAKASLAHAQQSLKSADGALASANHTAGSLIESNRWIAFSPDGAALVTGAAGGRVRLWSPVTGQPIDTLQSSAQNLTAVTFAGDHLVISNAETCCLWSLGGSWSLVRTIGTGDATSPLTDRVNALAFSPDGRVLATGSGEPSRSGQLKLWDVASGQLVREFKDLHSDAVLALEFSPDGRQLASGAADRLAKITDVATGQVLHTLEGHSAHVLGLSWKFDGRTLATCSADRQVRLWNAVTGDKGKGIPAFGKDVESVQFLGTSDQFVAASGNGEIRIVNEAAVTVRNVAGAKDFLQSAAATPDGRLLATGDENGQLLIWRDPAAPPTMSFSVPDRK